VAISGTVQRVSSYALLMEDERILLCRLSPHISSRGEWTLPGGGIEFGEHPEEAVVREVREETGLDVRLTELAHVDSIVFSITEGRMHAIRFIYRAEIIGGQLTHEADGSTDRCDWFTASEVRNLPLVTLAKAGVQIAFRSSRPRSRA
jgi:ADP-ribose pyrophosphatase YjhB (NUDIX family)